MRSNTRKNSSPRSSQRGMRCGVCRETGGGGGESGTEGATAAGEGAGLAVRVGDVISGCWDIPHFHLLSTTPLAAFALSSVQKSQSDPRTTYCNGNTAGASRLDAEVSFEKAA